MSYELESQALDKEILAVIGAWHERGETLRDADFNDLALRLFAYQLRYNEPYACYCERLGVTPSAMPASWDAIPALPAPSFKDVTVTTFDAASAALVFETSGTTDARSGRHYMENAALYDAALRAGFDRFILGDGARLRYFNCVPNAKERPLSSLGYMMQRVSEARGDGRTGWYVAGEELLVDAFVRDLRCAIEQGQPICVAATAFALVQLIDEIERRKVRFALTPGSRVMETGGFKGRTRAVDRDELYSRIAQAFGINAGNIIAEYGMTELTSQYYDEPATRCKVGPPWIRARVVGPERWNVPKGAMGALLHVDLANRSSCIAIQTEDLAVQRDGGFLLIGRDSAAEPRGCSLDADSLRSA